MYSKGEKQALLNKKNGKKNKCYISTDTAAIEVWELVTEIGIMSSKAAVSFLGATVIFCTVFCTIQEDAVLS